MARHRLGPPILETPHPRTAQRGSDQPHAPTQRMHNCTPGKVQEAAPRNFLQIGHKNA